jgi:hypothetical protein
VSFELPLTARQVLWTSCLARSQVLVSLPEMVLQFHCRGYFCRVDSVEELGLPSRIGKHFRTRTRSFTGQATCVVAGLTGGSEHAHPSPCGGRSQCRQRTDQR